MQSGRVLANSAATLRKILNFQIHLLGGCGKSRRGRKSSPQALKRQHIFSDLAARLKSGPSQSLRESQFFRSLLERISCRSSSFDQIAGSAELP